MTPDASARRVTVSVVVPTRDRPASLARCLAALAAQDRPPDEVLVVDDASTDAAAVAAVVAQARGATSVAGDGRGPAAARNLGAARAAGTLVAFTDDDCAPTPTWLAGLVEHLGDADAVAGPTCPPPGASAVVRAAQTVASYLSEASTTDGTTRFAPTSNLAVRADVLRRLPFDEDYPTAAGEDRDWCARLVDGGGTLRVAPCAVVLHHQDLTLRTFWAQQVRYGRGAHRFHRSGPGLARPAFYVGLSRRGFAQGALTGALVLAAQAATAVGMVLEAVEDRRCTPQARP